MGARMPDAYVVYNPAAGRYPSRLLTERAAAVLRADGWNLRLKQTKSGVHITQLARQASQEKADAFFVVGGDGSINRAVAGLKGTQTALGVLPAGTANVWAQELGLPGLTWTRWMALEESARRLTSARIEEVDLGICNERPFLLWAGIGLDAFIVHRLEPRRRWEKHFAVVQYAASAIYNASLWRGINLRVSVDQKDVSGNFLLAVVSNIHLYAGGYAELSPDARLNDGRMDLWLFKGETLGDTVQFAWELLSGRHQGSEQVEQFSFQNLHMESDSPLYLQVDGEALNVESGVDIHVQRQALKVLVPEKTPHALFIRESSNPENKSPHKIS
jgi:diacylglycerol kinase (ATP)